MPICNTIHRSWTDCGVQETCPMCRQVMPMLQCEGCYMRVCARCSAHYHTHGQTTASYYGAPDQYPTWNAMGYGSYFSQQRPPPVQHAPPPQPAPSAHVQAYLVAPGTNPPAMGAPGTVHVFQTMPGQPQPQPQPGQFYLQPGQPGVGPSCPGGNGHGGGCQ